MAAGKLSYPDSRRQDQVDSYFGVEVADPYRWLEDDNSAETVKWVGEQNRVTASYFEGIPYRKDIRARLEKLCNYPRYGVPFRNGEYLFFSRNDGLQNQSVYYAQRGLDGEPEVLIDPNRFSSDGTSQLAALALSRDGRYLAYGVSHGGSDWHEVHVMDVVARKDLPDLLQWVKISAIAWQGNGFYYSRYAEPKQGSELTSSNDDHKVYYHRVGTAQEMDQLVFEDKANPQRFHIVSTTEDERFAILTISDRGQGKKGNSVFVRDHRQAIETWAPLIPEIGDDDYGVIDHLDDCFLVQTNRNAPNCRVVLIDPSTPAEESWVDILPERPEPLESANAAAGRLFALYLKDVTTRAYVYDLTGRLENEIALPGPGTAVGFGGLSDDTSVFYAFTSFNVPSSIYRYDVATRQSILFRASEIQEFDAADFETRQVFFGSRDGTRVPMFIVHRKGLTLDGNNPTVLSGYGGFNVTKSPEFSSLRLALLEQGVVFASANLRGGGEYGEDWHVAGTKLNKQNVFDDFIAAAEHLIGSGYTRPAKLAIQGGSNGGLLVAVAANQRPELFAAVIAHAGVMDMLRFQKFTIGWNWVADYGSSDNEAEFKVLRSYSPVHNLSPGCHYPATMITTADHDDRVVPAHSFKYAAALQHAQGGCSPVLIRIDTKSGHMASSVTKSIEQSADIYAFIFENLGVVPGYR